MYNHNYGEFDYVQIHSELLKSVIYRKKAILKNQYFTLYFDRILIINRKFKLHTILHTF